MNQITAVQPQKAAFFNFDAQAVRVLGAWDAPWFVAKDVCAALGLSNPTENCRSLDDDEKGLRITETLGGPQELLTVNESGLYALIFRSRKPQARLFRRWVTGEVLPAIRKNGAYASRSIVRPMLGMPMVDLVERDLAALALALLAKRARWWGDITEIEQARSRIDVLGIVTRTCNRWQRHAHLGVLVSQYCERPMESCDGVVCWHKRGRARHRVYSIDRKCPSEPSLPGQTATP